jgi:NAD(P)-dependent dehydrogenase (short-subunit alcohol dehydrogenase family)
MAAKKTQSRNKSQSSARAANARATSSQSCGARLLGKVAVVTGASRGIGFAIARTLAAEGANVVITGRDAKMLSGSARKIEAAIPRTLAESQNDLPGILAQACDVRDLKSVAALFELVKQRFGVIDLLVNNAGVTQPMLTVEETSLELWHDVIDTNLTGPFLCTRAALPLMKAGATIVNNISAAAKQVVPKFAAYTAAKQGLLGFTLVLREELVPRGIRVVALMPGATDTSLWDTLWPDAPRERMMDADSVAQAVLYAALLPPNANLSEILLTPTGGAL